MISAFAVQTLSASVPTVSDSAGTRTSAEDVPINISGVTVGDADGGSLTVTVTAVSGTITLASTTSLSSLTGNGTSSIQFIAPIADANTALAGMTFTPTLNFNGAATFNVSANDGTTTTALGLKTITFTAVNDAPVGVADSATLTEDGTTATGNVLTNDTDPDTADTGSTETKTVSALSGGSLGVAKFGSYGYLMLSANGGFTYTLDGNLNAVQALASGSSLTETFTYTVADQVGLTATAILTVTITGANDRPSLVASSVIRTQFENITTAFLVSELLLDTQNASIGVDLDTGTQLGVAITASTTTDASTSMAGAWSYSLNNGTTWMPFPVVSGTSALLLPPTAQVRFVVTESTSIDSRNSGHVTLEYRAWDQSVGTAGLTANPTGDTSTGPYSSDSITAAMNVISVNDPPLLTTATLTVNENNGAYPAGTVSATLTTGFTQDSTLTGTLTGTLRLHDPDNANSQIVYRIEELPAKGYLTLSGATLAVGSVFTHAQASGIQYTPDVAELSATTTDRFYFTVRDGAGGEIGSTGKNTGSNPWAYVDVTIVDVNSPVRITGASLTVSENNSPPGTAVIAEVPLLISDADDLTNLRSLTVTSLPSSSLGVLQYWNGSAYVALTSVPTTILATSLAAHPLRFSYNNSVEPTDQSGSLVALYSQTSFSVTATDNRATSPSSTSATVSLSITPVNDPPVLVIANSPMTVALGSADNIIGNTAPNRYLVTTDPDSPVAQRIYSVTRNPEHGYLTLSGARLGGGFIFTEADLTAGNLKYSRNDSVNAASDSVKFVVVDGHGGTSAEGTLVINVSTPGTGVAFRAIVSEDLFVRLDSDAVSFTATATVTATKPSRGELYKAGVGMFIYAPDAAATTFTQADIDAGKIVYVNKRVAIGGFATFPSSEPSSYNYTDTSTLTITDGGSTTTATLTFTVTPVDDPPYIAQGNTGVPNDSEPVAVLEQQADGTDGRVGANFELTGVGSALKLRGGAGNLWTLGIPDHFHYYDSDSSSIQYYASTVKGRLARWSGTAWEYLSVDESTGLSTFSASDLNTLNIAYFHVPNNDVATASATTIAASVTVYAVDGGRVSAGDVIISSGTVSEAATRTVFDGATSIALPRLALNRSPSRTLTLTIQDVNDRPVGAAKTFTVTEYSSGLAGQTTHIQDLSTTQITVSDPDSDSAAFTYTVTVLPTNGKLQKSDGQPTPTWSDLAANATFTQAELTGSRLRYVNSGNVEVFSDTDWSTAKDSFQYTVADGDGSTSTATTVSVKLRPTNEPPKLANNGPGTVPEGGALKITGALLGSANTANSGDIVAAVDSDSSRTQVQFRITSVPAVGYLYEGKPANLVIGSLTLNIKGTVVRQFGVGSVFTLQDIQDGKLWYRHSGSEPSSHGGSVTFGYAVSDASGMAEPTATFTVNVTPVNDAPVVTGLSGGLNYTEADTAAGAPVQIDTSVSVADNDLANNGLDFRGGSLRITYASGGNAADQLGVANLGTGAGQIGVSGSSVSYANVVIGTVDSAENGVNGTALKIVFSPGANPSLTTAAVKALIEGITFSHANYNAAVTGTRTLTYTLVDGGGTAGFGDSVVTVFIGQSTWTGSATITVVSANDRPVLSVHTGGGQLPLGSIGENDTTSPTPFLVSAFLQASADTTHTGIQDLDASPVMGIAVTGSTVAAAGKWQYSATGSSWTDLGSVSTGSALLLTPAYSIRFLPDGLEGGTATLTYLAWDQTSGSAGLRVSTAVNATQTSAFSTASDTLAITVTPVNDAPTLTGLAGDSVTATEDATFSFSIGNRLTLADVDAGSGILSLSIALTGSGNYQFTSTSGIYTDPAASTQNGTWTGFSSASGTVTVYGTLANLNTLLGTLQYVPAANANNDNLASQSLSGTPTLALTISDRGYGENGIAASAQTASRTITLSITAVNDTPTIALSSTTWTVSENAGATVVSSTITSADINDAADTGYAVSSIPYLVVTALRGTLSLNASAQNLTDQLSNGNRTLTLTSTRIGAANAYGDLNAALLNASYLLYQPDANFSGSDTLTLTLHDASQAGSGGDKTATSTIAVTVGGNNNAPVFSGLDATPTFTEDGAAVTLDSNATVSDVELSAYNNWGAAVLTIARQGGANAEDVFGWTGSGSSGVNASGPSVRIATTSVGTFTSTGGTLTITFANATTTAQVNTVLQGITYANSNNNPPASVVLAFTINDANAPTDLTKTNPQGSGVAATASGSITITITANNDAPTLTGISATGYTENAAAITLASAAVPSDPELSYLASQAGDLGGVTLTLSRSVTANALDQFGWTGSGDSGVNASGSSVRIDTTSVGAFTSASGTLAITFASGVTRAQVQQVLRGITYQFTGESLGAAVTADITLNWVLNDGNVTAQGQGGPKSVTVAQTVTLTGLNDAPVLTDTILTAGASNFIPPAPYTEDMGAPVGSIGFRISTLASSSNITDSDTNSILGFAIIATDSTHGVWYYSLNNGGTGYWIPFTATASTARLFTTHTNNRLYFKPDANWNGTISSALTVRAWDAITGSNGGTVDLSSGSSTGGTTSYSTATDTVSLTVNPVNDAPTRTAATATLAAINEDQATTATDVTVVNNGATVSSLFSGVFSDATDAVTGGSSANAFAGVVVVDNSDSTSTTQGVWQYKTGASGTWTAIGTRTTSDGRYLDDADFIRFVPVAHFNGTPSGLVVRLADNSTDAVASGAVSINVSDDTTLSGGSTRYSSSVNAVTLNTSVTAINDAPLASGSSTLTAVNEDTATGSIAGATVSTLFSARFSDTADTVTGGSTANTLAGVAIVGNSALPAEGVWQYRSSGGSWSPLPTVTSIAGLLLSTTGELRFVPVADYNGTPGGLTVRLVEPPTSVTDGTAAPDFTVSSNYGGSTAYSSATVVLGTTITAVNDVPTLTATLTNPTVTENSATGSGTSIDPVNLVTGAAVSDLDLTTTTGLSATVFGAGTLTATLTDGVAGDVLQISGSLPTGVSVSGGTGSTALSVSLDADTTLTEVQNLLNALQYKSTSDNPSANSTESGRTYTVLVSDGRNAQGSSPINYAGATAASSATLSGTITITQANDAPVVDSWTEGQNVTHTAVTLAPSATLTDADNEQLSKMTLVVGGIVDGNQERIFIGGTAFPLSTDATSTDVGSFLVSYVAGTGTGTFTVVPDATAPAIATKTSFQSLLQGITYLHNSDNPTDGDRTVAISVTDAGLSDAATFTSELISGLATAIINVDPVNDQPTITGLTDVSVSENAINAAAAVLDSDVTVTEYDSADYNGGTLTVSTVSGTATVSLPTSASTLLGNVQKAATGSNVEYYNGSSWIPVGTWSGGAGANFVVTWNSSATAAIAERVIENLTYANSSQAPSATRTLTLALNDGDGGSTQNATITVTIIRDNDAPSLSATTLGGTYVEQASAMTFVSGTIAVSDPDANADFYAGGAGSITVSLDGYQSGDTLAVLHQGTGAAQIGVSGSAISYGNVAFASFTGGAAANLVITFTSTTATPAAVQALIGQLRFSNLSNDDPTANGTDPSRVFTVTLNDGGNTKDGGSSTASLTASVTGTITITAVNDVPVVAAGGTLAYTENGAAAAIRPTLTIADSDDTQIAGATVTISAGFTTGDVLGFTDQNGITGSYTTGSGVLTLTGTTIVANYQTALQSVTYRSTSEDPTSSSASRTVTWSVTDANSDGAGLASGTATTTINITAVNDTPTLATPTPIALTDTVADDSFSNSTGTLVGADRDSGTTLSYGISGGTDSTLTVSKTGTYGTLTVTKASGDYTFVPNAAAINGLSANTSETFTVSVNDNASPSLQATAGLMVNITAVNDTPVLSAVTPGTVLEQNQSANTTDTALQGTLSGTDADDATLTYGIQGETAAGGLVSKAGSYGTLTVTTATRGYAFTKNTALIEALDDGETRTDSFSVTVTDGKSTPVIQTYTVTVTGADDPATLGTVTSGAIIEVDQSSTTTDFGLTGTLVGADVDGETLTYGVVGGTAGTGTTAGTVSKLGTYGTLTLNTSSGAGTVSKLGTYGTLTLNTSSGAYTFTKNTSAIEALDVGESATDTFTMTVGDGDGDLITRAYTVRVTGADDAPTPSPVTPGTIAEVDQSAATIDSALSGTLSCTDADGDTLAYGIQGGTSADGTVSQVGSFGTLTVNTSSGVYAFTKNTSTIEALDVGESGTDTFQVTVADGDGSPVSWNYTVTVTGADDPATLGPVTPGTIAEVDQSAATTDAGLGGTLLGADVDVETLTYGLVGSTAGTGTVSKVGAFGRLTMNPSNGVYTFTKNASAIEALDVGESGTDTFTMTVGDGDGDLITRTYTVSVTGADDPATLGTVTPGTIAEVDQSATTTDSGLVGTLVGADVDGETLTYGVVGGTAGTGTTAGTVSKLGTYGTLTLNTSSGA
ncbi:MAG: Ig-like domain-containing protein, partial [Verrucomicrobia bacterium]|nr:Ig-like domain-containing protein [Verrucomicrobiota bacterium]